MSTSRCHAIIVLLVLCTGCRNAGLRTLSTDSAPVQKSMTAKVTHDRPVASQDIDEESSDDELRSKIVNVSAEVVDGKADLPDASAVTQFSLIDCISLALSENPDLIALREADGVSSAALGVAQTYPFNPYVQVQATPYQNKPDGGDGTVYHYVLLMQTIQLAHQQQFREQGAASTLNSTRWNIHQAELLNVAQTERLYFTVEYLQRVLQLAKASHENNQQLLTTLQKQLDAGQATAADVAIVRVDANSTRQQMRLANANYETTLRDLKRQLGKAADEPMLINPNLLERAWHPPLRSDSDNPQNPNEASERQKYFVAARAASRPDVLAAQSDVEAARANLCLASAMKVPDLQLGPYYQRTADGTTFLGFRAQMDIPVMNSGRPLERQRVAELKQRVVTCQQILRRTELEAIAAWERYRVALENTTDDSSSQVLDLPTELNALEQQFLVGEIDVVRVVQARTSMIQNQRARLDLLNELAQAAANLTATATIAIDELLPPTP